MKTRTILLTTIILLSIQPSMAQKSIELPKPDLTLATPLMQSLSQRHSERAYSAKELPLQKLSNLLWAANGVNRKDGRRTAPSAVNAQDIDVYLLNKNGGYLYNAQENRLEQITDKDLRQAVAAGQNFAATAPVVLLLVCDGSKFPMPDGAAKFGGIDCGYVSQNIYLYCTAAGLATVARAMMDANTLKTGLGLKESQTPLLNHPVGYPAE